MAMPEQMLTTSDNPWNPFTNYDEWFEFDTSMGYNTPAYLARITITSDELSDADQDVALRNAFLEILAENITGNYLLVTEDYVFGKS